jgi:hypothetical protein
MAEGSEREVYAQVLADEFPWVTSERLVAASDFLYEQMSSPTVTKSASFDAEARQYAEEVGRRLAEMLGKAPSFEEESSVSREAFRQAQRSAEELLRRLRRSPR